MKLRRSLKKLSNSLKKLSKNLKTRRKKTNNNILKNKKIKLIS